MPSAIDTTLAGESSNSYVTLVEATTYFSDRPRSTTWEDADEEDQIKALLQAARILDTRVTWKGYRATYVQSMAWPRTNVPDPVANDGSYLAWDVIPRWLKEAQCEQAIDILSRDAIAESSSSGIASVQVGPIGITYEEGGSEEYVLPRPVRDLVSRFGSFEGQGSVSFAKVIRT